MMKERRWEVRNGNTWGDEEGDWTYIGSRITLVVVYVLSNYKAGNKIEKLKIGKRVESDHQPVEVTLKMQRNREKAGSGRNMGKFEKKVVEENIIKKRIKSKNRRAGEK